jgi:hypothetical protein
VTLKLPPTDDAFWDRILAAAAGEDLKTYQAWKDLNGSLDNECGAYLDLPVEQWPPLNVNWDLSPAGQRFAFDGMKEADFRKHRPNGFRLGRIPLSTFDRHLCHYSRRDGSAELWELGSRWKLAKAIAYLRRGLPITPPLVTATEGEFRLAGGHHRYAIAKAVTLAMLPIYVDHADVTQVEAIATVEWGPTESVTPEDL